MQNAQVSRRGWHVLIQAVTVIWLILYFAMILFYPALGQVVDKALTSVSSGVLVWVALVGFPLISSGLFVYLAQHATRPGGRTFWTLFINLIVFFGLMTIVLTLITGVGWIDFLNLNTPAVSQLPLG